MYVRIYRNSSSITSTFQPPHIHPLSHPQCPSSISAKAMNHMYKNINHFYTPYLRISRLQHKHRIFNKQNGSITSSHSQPLLCIQVDLRGTSHTYIESEGVKDPPLFQPCHRAAAEENQLEDLRRRRSRMWRLQH